MKLCSGSSPVCSGRGGGGPISLEPICCWMLMKGELSLCRARGRVHASPAPGTAFLCHAVCTPGCSRSAQMKYPLGAVFLPARAASWRVHPAGHGQSVCAGPKNTHPSEFPDPVGRAAGLWHFSAAQWGPGQAETLMEPLSLSQSFPLRGACWGEFADSRGFWK